MRSQHKRLIFNQIRTQILFLTTLLNPALITSTTRALEHSTTTRAEKKKKKILFSPVAFYHRPQRIRNCPSPPPVLLLSITWNFPFPSGRPVSHPKCISDSYSPLPSPPPVRCPIPPPNVCPSSPPSSFKGLSAPAKPRPNFLLQMHWVWWSCRRAEEAERKGSVTYDQGKSDQETGEGGGGAAAANFWQVNLHPSPSSSQLEAEGGWQTQKALYYYVFPY